MKNINRNNKSKRLLKYYTDIVNWKNDKDAIKIYEEIYAKKLFFKKLKN